jgi:hypothetical protein
VVRPFLLGASYKVGEFASWGWSGAQRWRVLASGLGSTFQPGVGVLGVRLSVGFLFEDYNIFFFSFFFFLLVSPGSSKVLSGRRFVIW